MSTSGGTSFGIRRRMKNAKTATDAMNASFAMSFATGRARSTNRTEFALNRGKLLVMALSTARHGARKGERMDNICGNCEYYKYSWDDEEYICTSEDSEECGITVDYDGNCEYWEERDR